MSREDKRRLGMINLQRRELDRKERDVLRGLADPNKPRPSSEFLDILLRKFVEGCDHETALQEALLEFNKDTLWYDEIKLQNIYGMNKRVVKKYVRLKGYRDLCDHGLDTRVLKRAKHTSEHYRLLSAASKSLKKYEALEKRVASLEARANLTDSRLDAIETLQTILAECVASGVDILDTGAKKKREIGLALLSLGFDQGLVASILEVSAKTVKRWNSFVQEGKG